jgi:hypothetical protein
MLLTRQHLIKHFAVAGAGDSQGYVYVAGSGNSFVHAGNEFR